MPIEVLDLWFRYLFPDDEAFKLSFHYYKRKTGALLKEYFSSWQSSLYSTVQCLHAYEQATKVILKHPNQPFSCVKPHNPAEDSWLWWRHMKSLKHILLHEASIPVAVGKSLHIADVLKTADWSSESTFQQFYYQSSHSVEKNFAQSLLSTQGEKLPMVTKE